MTQRFSDSPPMKIIHVLTIIVNAGHILKITVVEVVV